MSKYPIRFTADGFHQYRNDYKKSSIQGTHVTFEDGRTHALTVAHVPQVLESYGTDYEKESDILTNIKRKEYDFKTFTFIDLFAGIGGFRQALDNLGGHCVFASEIDKFAAKAYETLYGHKPEGDITQIDAKDVPDHDLLVGGFPCQAFSVAGNRKGFEDTRGTLFFEIARVAKEKQPKALLLENVKGLVNHDKGRTLDIMIETLNDIGYTVDFDVLNSKYFGVPQNRERIFIVAIRDDLIEQEKWSEEVTKGQTVVPRGKRRLMKYDWLKSFNFDWPEQSEVTTRLRDILESNVDEKYYLDEDKTAKLVAQLEDRNQEVCEEATPMNVLSRGAETKTDGTSYCLKAGRQQELIEPKIDVVGRLELSKNDRTNRVHSVDGISPTPSGLGQGGGTEPKIAEPQMLGHVDIKGNDSIKRTYSTEGISPTLTTMGGGHREPKIAEEQIPRWIPKPSEINRTLRSGGKSSLSDKHNYDHIAEESSPARYRIRKLTPLECWRLQGFPDEAHEAVKQAGISDSQRYKQAGNAVSVPVIYAIGERLVKLFD